MSNAIRCIYQRFAFKNSRILCLTLIFNLNIPRTTVLYAKKKSFAGGEIRWSIYRFFQAIDTVIQTNGLVVKVSCIELGDLGSNPDECWVSLQHLCHFVWHWPRQRAHSHSAFYIAELSIIFLSWISSVVISRWVADRVLNLHMTIWLPPFWRTWTWAQARIRPHVHCADLAAWDGQRL